MNTMEITKVVAGVCGALLILLLLKLGAESYYFGEGGEEGEAAYTIEVAEVEGDAVEEVVIPFAELLAAADIAKGEKVSKKCMGCHTAEPGRNGASAPTLFGVVGRAQASEEFGYSNALISLGGNWTTEALNEFLIKPRDFAPGTSMSFGGLGKERDRVNLIAYLSTLN